MAVAMEARVLGRGEPVVLVGGGLAGALTWDAHAARLSSSRTVVLLQPLAVQLGLEGKPLPPDYSVALEGRAVGAALDRLGRSDPIDVVAWSFGALATLDFALAHPSRIRTLVLIEPPAWWVLHAAGLVDEEARASDASMAELGDDDISEAQLERFLTVAGLVPPGASVKELPQWPVWSRHRQSLRNTRTILSHRDDLARLGGLDRPVLLVKGTGSSRFLHQATDAIAARLPRATVVELPAGHAPHLVSMDRFLDVVAAFQAGGAREGVDAPSAPPA